MASGKAGSGSNLNRVADAMLAADPYDIKVAISWWANFNFACQGAQRWDDAMSKLPFYVHIGTNPSEMAHFADIVLPAPHHMFELNSAYLKSKFNLHAWASLHQQLVKPLWDTRQEETEFVWMLAEKLKEKGFDKLYAYLSTEFKDPETGKTPANGKELSEIATKIHTVSLWKPKETLKGDKIEGWEDFKKKGMYNSEPYSYKKKWGGKFGKTEEKDGKKETTGTVTHKFEFYSETLKKALQEHAEKHKMSIDDAVAAAKYTAKGELAFVPHYEPPLWSGDEKAYPFAFIGYKSRLNREGRAANCSWYQEFKKVDPGDEAWDDVIKINPVDGAKLGIKTGDIVKVTSVSGSITVKVKLWEGVRPGTATKSYRQGHWAYGRTAAKDFHKRMPRGGNNNEIMPVEYERLSGSGIRHGYARVKIEKA